MVFGQVDEILDAFLQAMVRPNAVFDSTGIQLLACLASFQEMSWDIYGIYNKLIGFDNYIYIIIGLYSYIDKAY